MKMHTVILILSITLIGIVVAGCNETQEATGGSKPSVTLKVEVKDDIVTARVKTALLGDEEINSYDIAVITLKGDVKLTGVVDSQSQIDYVVKLVRSIEGVHSIHDELTIKR